MMHIRKKLLFIAAIVIAVCSAFTSEKYGPVAWRFTGNEYDWTQRINPAYYAADGPVCITGENHFCKIIAYSSGGRPVITYQSMLYDYLVNGQDVLPQPITGLIYLKE